MNNSIENIRSKCARFYKVDLHLHSPLSFDWKNDDRGSYVRNPLLDRISSNNEITDEKLEAFISEIEKSNLDVVAITDHMKFSFGVELAEYVRKTKRKVLVLPGIEINVRFSQPLLNEYRIHILAIFPPDIGRTKIDTIFPPEVKDEDRRNGQTDEVNFDNIKELIDKVHGLGGKTIAAHIYSQNGIRYAYTKQTELILKPLSETEPEGQLEMIRNVGDKVKGELFKFDCLQVTNTTDPVHFTDQNKELRIPLISSNDAHHIELLRNREKITYIKMGSLNFECLCEAFKIPDTRIRFKNNLPETKPPRIRGVEIIGQQTNEKSFFKKLVVGFSDNLTCIVGPRGSGKSALIDAIRYVMGYNRSLCEIEKVQKQVLDRQKHTLQTSKVMILYEKSDSILHNIASTYDEKEDYNTTVYDLDNNQLNIEDVEACSEYPLNLYGWNELELLGEDPKTQRELLDRFIKDLLQLKNNKQELYNSLKVKSNQCMEQLDVLDDFFDPSLQKTSFVRLDEFEKEFKRLNTEEIGEHFKNLDEISQKISFLSGLKNEIRAVSSNLVSLSTINIEPILEKYSEINEWCNKFVEDRLKISSANDELLTKKNELIGILNGFVQIIEKEEEELIIRKNEASKEIRSVIGEEQSITADLRNNAKKRLDTAKKQFEDYKSELNKFELLMQERQSIILEIKKLNQRIFATRNSENNNIISKIKIINDEDFNISLKLLQERDRSDFLAKMENNTFSLEFKVQWKKRKLHHLICDKLTPFTFGESLLNNTPENLVHKMILSDNNINQSYELDADYAKIFIGNNIPFEFLAVNATNEKMENDSDSNIKKYNKENLSKVFSIQQVPFDDQFFIELNGKPIQYCSPGQRCSAMLPIVTLTSDAPIIIDQPEDNLDNRLVSRAIFKILSKLKETRQIIVATHNPNILVSGDAEQVIVLKDNGEVDDYGSIDSPTIIQNVIELMEGGKEAFERRRNKYKIT